MRGKVLVDLRNVYDREEAEEAGLTYHGSGVGRRPVNQSYRSSLHPKWFDCV